MSRSRRKTPIFGHANSPSEKEDKKIWHGRWRARERSASTNAAPETYETIFEKQVSNVWTMAKDGRSYWPLHGQTTTADRLVLEKGRNHQERIALKLRLLRKWMAK
jgi:hypothetical protein